MKIRSLFFSLVVFFNIFALVNAREILIGISPIRPPFMYVNEKDEIVGFDPDLAVMVLKKMGHTAKFVNMQFDGLIPSLTTGKIDMIASGLSITEERKKIIDYSAPYNTDGSKVVVLKNDKMIKSLKDLKGKTIGAELGTRQADFAEANKEKYGYKLVIFNAADEMFVNLIKKQGGIQAIIENNTLANEYNKKSSVKVKTVGELLIPSEFGFGFKKGNEDFVKEFDMKLKELKDSGEVAKLHKKYFGD